MGVRRCVWEILSGGKLFVHCLELDHNADLVVSLATGRYGVKGDRVASDGSVRFTL